MGILHHVVGKVKEAGRWIGKNPIKTAAIGAGVALGAAGLAYAAGGGTLSGLAAAGAKVIGAGGAALPSANSAIRAASSVLIPGMRGMGMMP